MKKLTTILTLLICSNLYSQDVLEDAYTRIQLINSTTVVVTNKQGCPTAYDFKRPDDLTPESHLTTSSVQPDSSITVTFPHCGLIRIHPITSCNGMTCRTTGIDNTCLFVLAVNKPLYFYPKQDHNNLSIEFKLPDQPNPNDKYQIRYTFENGTSVTKDLPMNSPKGNVYSFNFKMW